MEEAVQFFYSQGLAPSSQKAYKSAQSRYLNFCVQFNVQPLPLSENILCSFVAFLASRHVKFQTIKCYLSGVRHLQISNGFNDPFAGAPFVKLDYVLRGVRRSQSSSGSSVRPGLPITPAILRTVRAQWYATWDSFDTVMLWAAFCLGFFGFMRAGEFTVPEGAYDADCHLSFNDIAVDSHNSPSMMQVRLKASKTDPFRHGVDLVIGKSGDELCPVEAMMSYLAARGDGPGPLFLYSDGHYLTREKLVLALRQVLSSANIDMSHFSGHSFRIGAATTAARAGV